MKKVMTIQKVNEADYYCVNTNAKCSELSYVIETGNDSLQPNCTEYAACKEQNGLELGCVPL